MTKRTAQRLKAAGLLIDSGGETHDEGALRDGIAILDEIAHGQLSAEESGILDYSYGNAYSNLWGLRLRQNPDLTWNWCQEESERSVFYFRASLLNLPDTDLGNFRRYQALTNLGNALNTFGRFVDAQRYWLLVSCPGNILHN